MGTGTVYPVAPNHPDMSGNLIPTLYAMRFLIAFYAATVFGAIANTEYEGQITKYGDKVKIRMLADVTIRDYVKGQKLVYENPETSTVDLLIDKGKYWAFAINLVDKRQADLDYVDEWAKHASSKQKIAIDKVVLADIPDDVHASNMGSSAGVDSGDIDLGTSGTPMSLTKANVIDKIVDCGLVLDEQNVPDENRWLVLPTWATAMLKKSDLKDASMMGDGKSVLRNGRIGMIDRFEIFGSNSLATTADGGGTKAWSAMFGQKSALTFATQITEKETLPNPDDFGQIMRALQVFGFELVKPEAAGHLYIDKG